MENQICRWRRFFFNPILLIGKLKPEMRRGLLSLGSSSRPGMEGPGPQFLNTELICCKSSSQCLSKVSGGGIPHALCPSRFQSHPLQTHCTFPLSQAWLSPQLPMCELANAQCPDLFPESHPNGGGCWRGLCSLPMSSINPKRGSLGLWLY